jgi:catechol 2,3-dioxygenase-like lactoylglutathione lyase family enzyme
MSDPSPRIVGGLYEAFHAVPDVVTAIRHWQAFGYRIGPEGRLDAAAAKKLYGVGLGLRSVRLYHQKADHGLIRLMMWDGAVGDGLGERPIRGLGTRWTGQKTLNMARLNDHAAAAQALGEEVWVVPPFFVGFTPPNKQAPFTEALPGVREMVALRAHTRQVFIEFVGWELPQYGQINPDCLFQTSQFTHQCLMVQDDSKKCLAFYDDVLGMVRLNESTSPYKSGAGPNQIFDLADGETFHVADFDDPRATNAPTERRSGRLKIIRVEEGRFISDWRDLSRPGHLGYTGYSLRVNDFSGMREKIQGSGATAVTDAVTDEFGSQSFSFNAPDGNFWTAIEA